MLLSRLVGASGAWFLMDFAHYGNTVSSPLLLSALGNRPNQEVSQIIQWLKGISSRVLLQEFSYLRKKFWGRHLWARGYLAVSSGTITDEMIREYIDEQEGEQSADDSRFQSTVSKPLGFQPRVVQFSVSHAMAWIAGRRRTASIVSVLGLLVTAFMLPETKGKSLEELSEKPSTVAEKAAA